MAARRPFSAVSILSLLILFTAFEKHVSARHQPPVNLTAHFEGIKHLFNRTRLPDDEMEALWQIKRHRLLTGDITPEEREHYVSKHKAPIFIIGAPKGQPEFGLDRNSRTPGGTTALWDMLTAHKCVLRAMGPIPAQMDASKAADIAKYMNPKNTKYRKEIRFFNRVKFYSKVRHRNESNSVAAQTLAQGLSVYDAFVSSLPIGSKDFVCSTRATVHIHR